MRWAATSKRRCGASSPSRRSRSTTSRAGTCIERAAHCCPPRTARAMTVYVDDAVTLWRGHRWAHLMADTLDELHDFAARLGIPRRAFQDKTSGAHYAVTAQLRERAIELGAMPISRHDDRALMRRVIANARIGRAHV